MKLTGILSTSVHEEAEKLVPHGISVAPGVVASNHQHLFCVRIDPAVDDPNGESQATYTWCVPGVSLLLRGRHWSVSAS
jgi:primary-amine oxidase